MTVSDNDDPVLTSDDSPDNAGTGDTFTFDINTSDNIAVAGVNISWTHGGLNGNKELADDGDGTWSGTITLDHNVDDLTYYIQINDSAGNSFNSGIQTVTVSDNDDPTLTSDDSPNSAGTGDSFNFDINTSDNIGVTGVNVSWAHGGSSGNKQLANDGDGTWSGTITLEHNINDLTYYIQINDSAGNSFNSGIQTVTVSDNDDPTLTSDDSPDSTGTGDSFTFDINTSDNIAVAGANISWYHGGANGNKQLANDGDGTWSGTITLDHNVADLTYYIQINDSAGNSFKSGIQTVAVADNDDPTLTSDDSPNSAGTGDVFAFDINTSDNIGVTGVNVSWIHGGANGNKQLTDDGDGTWSGIITLEHDVGDLTYYIQINDSAGNSFNSGILAVSVADNDEPTLTSDDSNDNGGTGDIFTFDISVWDNIGVGSVNISWNHGGSSGNRALNDVGGGIWSSVVTLDNSIADLTYYIQINDSAGNSYNSGLETVTVTDNDAPEFGVFWNGMLTTGDGALFSFNLTEHIGIDEVKFDFIINRVFHYNWSVTNNTGDSWTISITFPTYAVSIEYYLWVNDTSGNEANTTNFTRGILDDDLPVVYAGPDITIDQHETVNFDSGGCGDNVGIDNYTWNFTCGGICQQLYGSYPSFTFHFAGNFSIRLRVTDEAGNWAEDIIMVNVNDITPPLVEAGELRMVNQHTEVTLNGSESSDNVGIVNYTWTFSDGESVQTLYGVIVNYLFDNAGSFNITLRAEDAAGNFLTDNVIVVVNDTTLPAAHAGLNITIDQHEIVHFDAAGSSDNVGIVEYTWNISLRNASVVLIGVNVSYQFHESGVFTVNLTVTDLGGNRDFNLMTVTVKDITNPVAAGGADRTVDQHEAVTFNASGSSDNDGIANFTWRFEYRGNTRAFSGGNEPVELYGEIVSFVFHDAGQYIITLIISDAAGHNDTDEIMITVKDITPPVADAGEDMVAGPGEKVTFSAGGSSDNVNIIKYTWTFEYNGETITLPGKEASFIFNKLGKYTIELNISDAAGYRDSDTIMVTVEDKIPPVVKAGPDISIDQHETVSFMDHIECSDVGGILSYQWAFHYDGTLISLDHKPILSELPLFKFDVSGTYEITVTVSDMAGNRANGVFNITVRDITPPTVNPGKNITVDTDGTVKFDGSGSSDESEIVNYTWTFEYRGEKVTLHGPEPDFRFEEEGRYKVILTVTDEEGNQQESEMYVEVEEPTDSKGETGAEKLMRSAGIWILGIVLLVIILLVLFFVFRKKKRDEEPEKEETKKKTPAAGMIEVGVATSGAARTGARRGTGAGARGRGKTSGAKGRTAARKGKRSGKPSPGAKGQMAAGRRRKGKEDRRKGKGRKMGARKREEGTEARKGRGKKRGEGRRKRGEKRESKKTTAPVEQKESAAVSKQFDQWDEDEWATKISEYGEEPDLDTLGEYSPMAEWDEDKFATKEEEEEEQVESFECPDCGAVIGADDDTCHSCGAEFEEEEDEVEGVEDEMEEEGEESEWVEFTGGRYAAEEEVDFMIDMDYFEFEEGDFGFECPDCGSSMGAEDTVCPGCGIEFDEGEEAPVWE